LSIGDLEFWFRPIPYKFVNDNNQMQMEQQQAMAMQQQMQAQGGADAMGGAPPPEAGGGPPMGSQPPNGIESAENMPPTAPPQESIDTLHNLKNQSLINENMEKVLIFDRIIKKYNTKLKMLDK
jgi:hypothetical protein